MAKRKKPKIEVHHFAIIDGKEVEINPAKTDLPNRCKLFLADFMTGQKYELVKKEDNEVNS